MTARHDTELRPRYLDGRAPEVSDFEALPYLEQIIKESLRLYPPASTLLRYVRESFIWQGFMIPAGSIVMCSPLITHRMDAYYADPYRFEPEGFDPDSGEPHKPHISLPFGASERSCIGAPFAMLELKTVMAMLTQRYRLDLVPNQRTVAALRTMLFPKYAVRMIPRLQAGEAERSSARVTGNVIGATANPV